MRKLEDREIISKSGGFRASKFGKEQNTSFIYELNPSFYNEGFARANLVDYFTKRKRSTLKNQCSRVLKILRITALFFAPACFIIWTLIKLNKENLLKNTNRTFAVGRRLWVLFVFSFYCNITVNFICWKALFLKKLSKLFCFLEDNLALAKFQSPTDTPLNHNLPQHLEQNLFSIIFSKFFIKV